MAVRNAKKSDAAIEEFITNVIAHYGVLGMKWGVRRRRPASSSSRSPVSPEAARAVKLQGRASKHGTRSLTNAELKDLVTRMNLENQYGNLNPAHVTAGKRATNELLKVGGGVAKATATAFAAKYAAKGVEELIKMAAKK